MVKKDLEILSMCCICKAIKVGGRWMREEENPELYQRIVEKYKNSKDQDGIPAISHGICNSEECYNKFVGRKK